MSFRIEEKLFFKSENILNLGNFSQMNQQKYSIQKELSKAFILII